MPKKTRMTVATTTATNPIMAPKLGPSPRSTAVESSQLERGSASSRPLPHQVGDQVDRARGKHRPAGACQDARPLDRLARIAHGLGGRAAELVGEALERGRRER